MKEQFLKELAELLAKYNAEIYCYAEGDLSGIHSESIDIYIGKEIIKRISGIELTQYDLKEKPTV